MPESPRSPLVVLLLITNFDIGGAERVYVHTAKALAERGARVLAVCLQWRSGRVASELAGTGVEVFDLRMRGRLDLLVILRLVGLLRREGVHVIYTFLIHSHILGRLAARIAKVPVVLSSQQIAGWETWTQRRLNQATARWCSAIVAVSRSVEEYLVADVGIARGKLVTIYNCVDLDRFPQRQGLLLDPSRPLLGTLARLNPEKDYDTLLAAFQHVHQRFPSARLLIGGDGPDRSRLETRVQELSLDGSVQFLGHIDDVRPVLAKLDVYIQSSHVEGLSVAVLEALASGVPVVAARVGGNDEAVLDKVCGLLVEPRNPTALAEAICQIVKDPEMSRRMGNAARSRVAERFSRDVAMARTEALIRQFQ